MSEKKKQGMMTHRYRNHNITSPILNLKKLLDTTVILNIAISLYTAFDSISVSKLG